MNTAVFMDTSWKDVVLIWYANMYECLKNNDKVLLLTQNRTSESKQQETIHFRLSEIAEVSWRWRGVWKATVVVCPVFKRHVVSLLQPGGPTLRSVGRYGPEHLRCGSWSVGWGRCIRCTDAHLKGSIKPPRCVALNVSVVRLRVTQYDTHAHTHRRKHTNGQMESQRAGAAGIHR